MVSEQRSHHLQTPSSPRRRSERPQYWPSTSFGFNDHGNLARREHPCRVFIPFDSPEAKEGGLRTDSIVMTDNLATILDKAIAGKLGRLKEMTSVDAALRRTLGL